MAGDTQTTTPVTLPQGADDCADDGEGSRRKKDDTSANAQTSASSGQRTAPSATCVLAWSTNAPFVQGSPASLRNAARPSRGIRSSIQKETRRRRCKLQRRTGPRESKEGEHPRRRSPPSLKLNQVVKTGLW
jgi:hypothetical protein